MIVKAEVDVATRREWEAPEIREYDAKEEIQGGRLGRGEGLLRS